MYALLHHKAERQQNMSLRVQSFRRMYVWLQQVSDITYSTCGAYLYVKLILIPVRLVVSGVVSRTDKSARGDGEGLAIHLCRNSHLDGAALCLVSYKYAEKCEHQNSLIGLI